MSDNKVIFIVFSLVRSVHNSDFMLVANEALNKWGPVFVKKPGSCSNRESCFLTQPLSLMIKQYALTHPPTRLQDSEKTWPILIRPTLRLVLLLRNCKNKQLYCGHNILTENVFVAQMSSYEGICVWRIEWVTTNYHLINNIFSPSVVARVKILCPRSAGQLHSLQ